MLLCELFGDDSVNVVDEMRSMMIDVLTPLAANQVPYVTVQQVIDRLQEIRSGVRVDRAMVMTILDPNAVEMIDKIEGDRIYLTTPQSDEVAKREDDKERDRQEIQKKAAGQAQKEVQDDAQAAQQARNAVTQQ